MDTFSLQNLHPHQVEFMKNFEKQNGISFLLIYYTHRQKCYYLRFSEMIKYWERMEAGGQKNFKYEELSPKFFVPAAGGIALHYLVEMLEDLKANHQLVITLEDGVLDGGFGEKLARYYGDSEMKVKNYGLKKEFADRFVLEELLKENHLTDTQITNEIREIIDKKQD